MAKTKGEGSPSAGKTKSYVQQGKTVNRNKAADKAAYAASSSIQRAEAKQGLKPGGPSNPTKAKPKKK